MPKRFTVRSVLRTTHRYVPQGSIAGYPSRIHAGALAAPEAAARNGRTLVNCWHHG